MPELLNILFLGVLVKVPVMLSVVWIINRNKSWCEAKA